MSGLEGFAALVTGGGSGIGLGCARRLVVDGASVTIVGRTEDRLAAAVEELAEHVATGATVQYAVADVTDEDAIAAAVARACTPTGGLDAAIACAGGSETLGPITQMDTDAWRRTIDLNITGTMLTIKYAARPMAAAGSGSIVGISSIASTRTHRWFGAYGPGKAGIDHICKVAADELGASGVRVNSIQPGLVDTDLVSFVTAGGPVLDSYFANMPIAPGRHGRGHRVVRPLPRRPRVDLDHRPGDRRRRRPLVARRTRLRLGVGTSVRARRDARDRLVVMSQSSRARDDPGAT